MACLPLALLPGRQMTITTPTRRSLTRTRRESVPRLRHGRAGPDGGAQGGHRAHTRLDTGILAWIAYGRPVAWGASYLMARSRTSQTPCMMEIARNVAAKLADDGVHARTVKRQRDTCRSSATS